MRHEGKALFRLLGPFAIEGPDGADLTPKGRRAKALLALVALAPNGARSRRWIQDKLWSDRPPEQGSASLRQEISAIRRAFRDAGLNLLDSDRDMLRLDRRRIAFDIDDPAAPGRGLDLLEGLDVGDPEFEDWLRDERARRDAAPPPEPPATLEPTPPRPPAAVGSASKPLLVVRGFTPIGGSDRARVFAEGLTDELLTVLGTLKGAFVVRTNDRGGLAGSRYELSGHVRDGDRLRITAMLVELDTEECLWSGRFDYTNEASFDAQEEISRKVVEAAQIQLSDGEWARIWSETRTSLPAWEHFQRGRALESEAKKEPTRRAVEHYREALRADPDFTPAMISLGFCMVDELRLCWAAAPVGMLAEVRDICAVIESRAPADYFGRALRAFVEGFGGNHARACEIMAEVVRDAPESPELLAYYAIMLGYSGLTTDAIRYNRRALLLTPHPPSWIRTNLALACMMRGDADAERHVDVALGADPLSVRAHICKVVVELRAGRPREAGDWARRLLALEPEFGADRWTAPECFKDRRDFRRIADELRAAGL